MCSSEGRHELHRTYKYVASQPNDTDKKLSTSLRTKRAKKRGFSHFRRYRCQFSFYFHFLSFSLVIHSFVGCFFHHFYKPRPRSPTMATFSLELKKLHRGNKISPFYYSFFKNFLIRGSYRRRWRRKMETLILDYFPNSFITVSSSRLLCSRKIFYHNSVGNLSISSSTIFLTFAFALPSC